MQDDLFEIQDDFETSFANLVEDIKRISKKVAADFGYPEETLGIYENKTKSELNYPVQIRERRRELNKRGDQDVVVQEDKKGLKLVYICTPVMTLRACAKRSGHPGCVRIDIGTRAFQKDWLPHCNDIKEVWIWNDVDEELMKYLKGEFRKCERKNKKTGRIEYVYQVHELSHYQVFFDVKSSELLPYIEKVMKDRLKKYTSRASAYGCCHLYKECSKAGKCISEDRLYATACQYKRNLEAGKRFY